MLEWAPPSNLRLPEARKNINKCPFWISLPLNNPINVINEWSNTCPITAISPFRGSAEVSGKVRHTEISEGCNSSINGNLYSRIWRTHHYLWLKWNKWKTMLINHDCKTSFELIRECLFTCWKVGLVFDPSLHFFYFTGFSGHRPAQREWARTGLIGPMQSAIPTQSHNPSWEVGHITGVHVPYSFRTVACVLLRPTRTDQWKCCETGPTVFCLFRLEILTICRCHYKDSTFFSVI